MKHHITASHIHDCPIHLPASKSISNRALLISAMAGCIDKIENCALCDDTIVMREALRADSTNIDIHNAGTAMRFLTAYYAITPGEHILTGNTRMIQRPIGPLVDALRTLGANIQYTQQEGYPPLHIKGNNIVGGAVSIDSSISSQYISALLLIAPYMQQGLRLTLTGDIVSLPYIDMTIAIMQHYGARVKRNSNLIEVEATPYHAAPLTIESDWSAAAYWYEIAALSNTPFTISNISTKSTQGDSRIAYYMSLIGIETVENENTITITPTTQHKQGEMIRLNLCNEPDLAPTVIMTYAMMGQHFSIDGLHNLRIKECDRIAAIITEAARLGYRFTQPYEGCIEWLGEYNHPKQPITINTYDDHRIAMTFAPAALRYNDIWIDNPTVVEKSYPHFWHDMICAGFNITTQDGKEIQL